MAFPRSIRHVPVLLASFLVVAGSAACVPATTLPDDCDADSVTRQATLSIESLDPATIEVCRGQQVSIELSVEADAELHLHGYDDQVPEREVSAGQTVTLRFEATQSGNFPIEVHPADGSDEVEAGALVVHEH